MDPQSTCNVMVLNDLCEFRPERFQTPRRASRRDRSQPVALGILSARRAVSIRIGVCSGRLPPSTAETEEAAGWEAGPLGETGGCHVARRHC
jgi:hypothetical protein